MLLRWDRVFDKFGLPKKIVVVGYGKSGFSISRFLSHELKGVEIVVTEKKDLRFPKVNGVNYFVGEHDIDLLYGASWVVKSPGILPDLDFFKEARRLNIPVIGDLDLTFGLLPDGVNTIGITGTNGKTTVTEWISYGFKLAGQACLKAGNVGTPLSDVIYDVVPGSNLVLELSSYQIEHAVFLKPRIAMITNLTPDHLERYKNIENYFRAKIHLFENQEEGYAVYNNDDGFLKHHIKDISLKSKLLSVSKKDDFSIAGVVGGALCLLCDGRPIRILPLEEISLKGQHNLENALFVASAMFLSSIDIDIIRLTLSTFEGVEHRQEEFFVYDNVKWINDSKATNPESTVVALKTWGGKKNIILMLGGRDKLTPLDELASLCSRTCRTVLLFGEAKERFAEALKGLDNVYVLQSLDDAIQAAITVARPGDIVLFSPACASFDMFSNFEERGRVFKEKVLSAFRERKDDR